MATSMQGRQQDYLGWDGEGAGQRGLRLVRYSWSFVKVPAISDQSRPVCVLGAHCCPYCPPRPPAALRPFPKCRLRALRPAKDVIRLRRSPCCGKRSPWQRQATRLRQAEAACGVEHTGGASWRKREYAAGLPSASRSLCTHPRGGPRHACEREAQTVQTAAAASAEQGVGLV